MLKIKERFNNFIFLIGFLIYFLFIGQRNQLNQAQRAAEEARSRISRGEEVDVQRLAEEFNTQANFIDIEIQEQSRQAAGTGRTFSFDPDKNIEGIRLTGSAVPEEFRLQGVTSGVFRQPTISTQSFSGRPGPTRERAAQLANQLEKVDVSTIRVQKESPDLFFNQNTFLGRSLAAEAAKRQQPGPTIVRAEQLQRSRTIQPSPRRTIGQRIARGLVPGPRRPSALALNVDFAIKRAEERKRQREQSLAAQNVIDTIEGKRKLTFRERVLRGLIPGPKRPSALALNVDFAIKRGQQRIAQDKKPKKRAKLPRPFPTIPVSPVIINDIINQSRIRQERRAKEPPKKPAKLPRPFPTIPVSPVIINDIINQSRIRAEKRQKREKTAKVDLTTVKVLPPPITAGVLRESTPQEKAAIRRQQNPVFQFFNRAIGGFSEDPITGQIIRTGTPAESLGATAGLVAGFSGIGKGVGKAPKVIKGVQKAAKAVTRARIPGTATTLGQFSKFVAKQTGIGLGVPVATQLGAKVSLSDEEKQLAFNPGFDKALGAAQEARSQQLFKSGGPISVKGIASEIVSPSAIPAITTTKAEKAFDEAFISTAKLEGIPENKIKASLKLAKREAKISGFGELATLIGVSAGAEVFGTRQLGKQFARQAGKGTKIAKRKLFSGQVFKKTAPTIALAGFGEASSQELAQQVSRNQQLNFAKIGGFGLFGAASAGALGGGIAGLRPFAPKTSRGVEFLANIADPFEFPGDVVGKGVLKLQRVPVITPAISKVGRQRVTGTETVDIGGRRFTREKILSESPEQFAFATQTTEAKPKKSRVKRSISPRTRASTFVSSIIPSISTPTPTSLRPSAPRSPGVPVPIDDRTPGLPNPPVPPPVPIPIPTPTPTESITNIFSLEERVQTTTPTFVPSTSVIGIPTSRPILRIPPPVPLTFPTGGTRTPINARGKKFINELDVGLSVLNKFLAKEQPRKARVKEITKKIKKLKEEKKKLKPKRKKRQDPFTLFNKIYGGF